MRWGSALFLLACLRWTPACASGPGLVADDERAVLDVVLTGSDGEPTELARFGGRPLLVFFFTTYDSASQLSLGPLVERVHQEPGLQVIGIALQPDPQQLLDLYARSLAVPFPLAFEPAGTLVSGRSALGQLGSVPQYVLLDGRGRIVRRYQGVLVGTELTDFLMQP